MGNFYMVRLPSKKKKNPYLSTHFFLACYRKHSFFFWPIKFLRIFDPDKDVNIDIYAHILSQRSIFIKKKKKINIVWNLTFLVK